MKKLFMIGAFLICASVSASASTHYYRTSCGKLFATIGPEDYPGSDYEDFLRDLNHEYCGTYMLPLEIDPNFGD